MYQIKALTYRYQTEVFPAFDLTIEPGEYLALMGENGSGKSTFLNLLAGFLMPATGEIWFEGKNLTGWQANTVQKKKFYSHLGILFQETDSQLFNSTVYDEIAFGPRQLQLAPAEVEQRVNDCLALLKLEPLKKRVPYQLSGGEKKKVAFASILAMNPAVYLLDEPFNGLTKETEKLFKQILKQLQQLGKTIILSSHDYVSIAHEADAVLLFTDPIKKYSTEEITADPTLYQQLINY